MFIEVDILLDKVRPLVIQKEINLYSSRNKDKSIDIFTIHDEINDIVSEIMDLKSMDGLKNYLIQGDLLDKPSVNKYLADLIFSPN